MIGFLFSFKFKDNFLVSTNNGNIVSLQEKPLITKAIDVPKSLKILSKWTY